MVVNRKSIPGTKQPFYMEERINTGKCSRKEHTFNFYYEASRRRRKSAAPGRKKSAAATRIGNSPESARQRHSVLKTTGSTRSGIPEEKRENPPRTTKRTGKIRFQNKNNTNFPTIYFYSENKHYLCNASGTQEDVPQCGIAACRPKRISYCAMQDVSTSLRSLNMTKK